MSDPLVQCLRQSLDGMSSQPPESLPDSITFYGRRASTPVRPKDLWARLRQAELDPDDFVRRAFHAALSRWDYEEEAAWTLGTDPRSEARRTLIYDRLEVPAKERPFLTRIMPRYVAAESQIKIAADHAEWYTPERQLDRSFYWTAYQRYLRETANWHPDNIAALGKATHSVVESLSDPTREAAYQAKGLVMGFVQSGKTANFTGVLAKAADAGYRLFIVLSGMHNILRAQTQRRLDRELVGRQSILSLADPATGDHEYSDDAEWDTFVDHDSRAPGYFEWHRLTGRTLDYRALGVGIQALSFRCQDASVPYYHPSNLHPSPARLIVAKKERTALTRLVADLGRIGPALRNVPALIIDDESDQASHNTYRITSRQQQKRTTINRLIIELLQLLPRGQYVGYTATPFANVFADVSAEDLFPKDFILSLETARGYMGPRDFHDLDPPRGTRSIGNKDARVRDVEGRDEELENLPKAIDSFILSGAIKLYRRDVGATDRTRHHTMLVHTAHQMAEHSALAGTIRALWDQADYLGNGCRTRLRDLYANDFLPVLRDVHQGDGPYPADFPELWPYIGEAYTRITSGGSPVLVVNGDRLNEAPDFDGGRVWKIIVGGTKLSRGYTVEGLTVSYYRRSARAQDTLTQMGRWFGYRDGYRDLVRLFVGRAEVRGRKTFDLYEAFEAACLDEIDFRESLRIYEKPSDDRPRLTPYDVPPLVRSTLPWLKPTARNKMYNAEIASQNFGGVWTERTLVPAKGRAARDNLATLQALVGGADVQNVELGVGRTHFPALVGEATPDAFIQYLDAFRWVKDKEYLARQISFLRGEHGDPEVQRWLIILPQLTRAGFGHHRLGLHDMAVVERAQVDDDGRFKAFSDPRHRRVAEVLAGVGDAVPTADLSAATASLIGESTGVVLIYLAKAARDALLPAVGMAILPPPNGIPQRIAFVNAGAPGKVFIDRPE